jgi:hypothetical protein
MEAKFDLNSKYITKIDLVFENQRDLSHKLFKAGTTVRPEGNPSENLVVVRQTYPNDDYFATVNVPNLRKVLNE